jgi:prepilin-type N-terminal cleavage/methylation domain-containing protein
MRSFFKKILGSKKNPNLSRGFSILELMIVLTIFAIMTTILIADIPNFRDKSSVDLTASEVATYTRGAQVYGAAQRGGDEGVSYGVRFDKGLSSFYLFRNDHNTKEESYDLKGFEISGILVRANNSYDCSLYNLEVVYKSSQSIGSSLDALVSKNNGSENIVNIDYADIMIRSARNSTARSCVRIYGNGQIANLSCNTTDSFANSNPVCSSLLNN